MVNLEKQVTQIFRANGRGKSRLSELLKDLETHEQPGLPIENVCMRGTPTPEFRYKFKNDGPGQVWTAAVGFRPRQAMVKYFDATTSMVADHERLRRLHDTRLFYDVLGYYIAGYKNRSARISPEQFGGDGNVL